MMREVLEPLIPAVVIAVVELVKRCCEVLAVTKDVV